MSGCIGTSCQFAFHRRNHQHVGVNDQCIDIVDRVVEIVFDLIEVAIVVVGDLRRDVPLGDPVDILSCYVQGSDD